MRAPTGVFVAASLAERAEAADDERTFGAVEIEFCQRKHDPHGHPHELARIADREDGRTRLVQSLARALGGNQHDAVLLPAVLGLDDDDVPALVSKSAGVAAGELATPLAGPQGLRLQRRIDAALAGAGVEIRDARVKRIVPAASGTKVELEGGEVLAPGATVLATGKHIGGGIAARRGDLVEPLAGLPLHDGGRAVPLATGDGGRDPLLFYGDGLADGGAGFRSGVGTDELARALGERGAPAAPDLFAAGAVLAGTDPGRDGTGLGGAATTGFVAGKNALKNASSGRP
jgi:glycerol-3-phosphate dehydrogenase subunit B